MRRRMLFKKQGGILPEEYQQVAYIQSTGTQYIDTGVLTGANVVFELNYQSTVRDNQNYILLGARHSNLQDQLVYFVNSAGYTCGHYTFGDTNNGVNTREIDLLKHTVISDGFDIYVDEQLYEIPIAQTDFSNKYNITIFALNQANTILWHSKIKLYNLLIKEDDELVRHFIPCYDTTDPTKHTAGLYDILNNQFYGNDGTGYFEVGPDV